VFDGSVLDIITLEVLERPLLVNQVLIQSIDFSKVHATAHGGLTRC
jgi:hypothetical protein